MLVLSRHQGERIHIGDNIVITVASIRGSLVRLGIDAPPEVRVLREEVRNPLEDEQRKDLALATPSACG